MNIRVFWLQAIGTQMNLGKNLKYSGVLEGYLGREGLVTKPGEGQEWCWASRIMGISA